MDHGVMHVKENEDNEECPIIQDNLHSRAAPKSPKWPEKTCQYDCNSLRKIYCTGCERERERETDYTRQDAMRTMSGNMQQLTDIT